MCWHLHLIIFSILLKHLTALFNEPPKPQGGFWNSRIELEIICLESSYLQQKPSNDWDLNSRSINMPGFSASYGFSLVGQYQHALHVIMRPGFHPALCYWAIPLYSGREFTILQSCRFYQLIICMDWAILFLFQLSLSRERAEGLPYETGQDKSGRNLCVSPV